MDKLFSLEECEKMAAPSSPLDNPEERTVANLARQLADTMRENERLRKALQPFASWPIVANGRIVGIHKSKNWNALITEARYVLSDRHLHPSERL